MSKIQIREVRERDLEQVVNLHIEAFNDFFLSSLGKRFLKTYYWATLLSKHGILLGAFEGNIIVAFASGTSRAKGYHRSLLIRNFIAFSSSLALIVIKKPGKLIRLYKNLDKKQRAFMEEDYAELLSIAVSPNRRGSGLSTLILDSFEKSIENQGVQRLSLTTDELLNNRAISFYRKNGYRILYKFSVYPNRKMLRMIKSL